MQKNNRFQSQISNFRGVLRSTVLLPVYSPPIDTVNELLETDMSLAVPSGTAVASLLQLDPRPNIQKLYKRHVLYPFIYGRTPDWVWKGRVTPSALMILNYIKSPCAFKG